MTLATHQLYRSASYRHEDIAGKGSRYRWAKHQVLLSASQLRTLRCNSAKRACATVTRSFQVDGPGSQGQIEQTKQATEQAPDPKDLLRRMKENISTALNAESVEIEDTYGDGRHVSISVVASSFEGKSSVKRQQAVYKAIWLELQDVVHAVDAMTTRTPAETES